ncbi:hypothetical protein Trydic_g22293 [Trypoxylus dichotomus]
MESTNNLVTRSVNDVSAKKTFKTMTFREKLSYIKTVITVEPLIAFYFIPSVICYPALYTLELEKACRVNGGFNDTICDVVVAGTGDAYEEENIRVQQIIANMHSWQNPMQNFVPIILILFLASYSDRHKIRKPFLLLPIVGEFFAITGCILSVVFMKQLPIEVQGFSQTVVPSFLGGSPTLVMAVFAYISDVSTIEMRTLRIGIVQILLTVCSLLSALGGYLFEQIGYYGVLGIGGAMYFIAFCYGVIFVKENSQRPKYQNCNSFLRDVFDPRHAIAALRLLIEPHKTMYKQLYLVLIVFFISALVTYGEASVFWLFALKTYGFTPVDYSYFDSIKSGLVVIGSLVFLPLFTKVFNLHDAVIVIITFLDKIASNVLLLIFVNTYGLYAGTIVANCHGIANTALRSLATKSVQVTDLAKALSLLSLCETIANTLAATIYSTIYSVTLAVYAEAFLFLAVILFGLCCIVITTLYLRFRSMFSKDEPKNTDIKESVQEKQDITSQTTKF